MTRKRFFTPLHRRIPAAALLVLPAIGTAGAAHAQATFNELSSTLSNGSFLDLYDSMRISADGSVITGTEYPTGSSNGQAVTLTGGSSTPTELGYLPGNSASYGFGISSNGATVVGASVGTSAQATEWTGGTATGLGTLSGYDNSVAYSVSDNGVVTGVASNSTSGASQVFQWISGGGMTSLGSLPSGYTSTSLGGTTGNTISSNGSVIAGNLSSATGAMPTQAFRWSSSTGVTALGVQSGGSYSLTSAVSADGNTVIGYGDNASGQQTAFRWTAGSGMTSLGLAYGTFQTNVSAASASTSLIVGDYFNSTAGGLPAYESGYIYSASYGYADIRDYLQNSLGLSYALENWTDIDAIDISANGDTIVGDGYDASGNYAYWTVTDTHGFTAPYTESSTLMSALVPYGGASATPEPGSLALLLPFATPIALVAARRRKARSA